MTPQETAPKLRDLIDSVEVDCCDLVHLTEHRATWCAECHHAAIRAAVEEEREACATMIEEKYPGWADVGGKQIADEIRARKEA